MHKISGLKGLSLVNQPLLNPRAVTECMQQGHRWTGNGLPWPMRESLRGRSGDLSSQHQGSGIDFSETRPYQPGDEPRHMNWRATARTGRPQVRVFHEELAPTSCFLIDRRASMRFGTRRRLKVSQAARLAIFLATWEARSGAELGELILEEQPHWQPPVSGQMGIHHLARLATQPCPPMPNTPQVDITQALALLAKRLPLGSHLYCLSDFHDLTESDVSILYQLGKGHRVWAINIYDPAEQQLPTSGDLQLVWNNTTSESVNTPINTHDKKLMRQHRQRFEVRQQQMKHLFERSDITFTSVSSDTDDIARALRVS